MVNSWKYLRYLFIPGIVFLIAGLVAQIITGQYSALYLGLITAGVFILIFWLVCFLGVNRAFWHRRATQTRANLLISSLAFLTILSLINYLAFRYSNHIDLTENQLYSLAPQTQAVLKALPRPVKALIFVKEADPGDQLLLNNDRQYNPIFQYEFVDPDIKPGLAKQFGAKPLGTVYLEYGNRHQLVQDLQLDPKGEATQRISESKLTSGLERIQKDSTEVIYILQGHQEPSILPGKDSISEAVNVLKDKGYQIKPLNLMQVNAFPKDINSLLIIGPKKKLLPPEVNSIKQYSEQGGNILLLVDPQIDPGLDPLLKEWGVKLDPRLVIDASGRGSQVGVGPESPVITQYGNHPITKEFKNGNSIFPLTRPIATFKVKDIQSSALLTTDDKIWATSKIVGERITFNPQTDLAGPFDIGVALTRYLNQKESKLVVVGNSTFATNGWFSMLLDGDFFVNSVQWLTQPQEHELSIRPKEPKNRRIILSSSQWLILNWLAWLIIPLLGLILAVLFWWKRR